MAELAKFCILWFLLDLKGSLITIDICSLLVSCMSFVAGVSCLDVLHDYLTIW